ncbi:hypothetical protein M569_01973 [Genlisea aurea]|uniref:Uncharacterized protein n=1 Tax=Genlisea aurea TaxID=192259 RepID=S8EJK0_9LAMI|nr:hypothetical protein M569_01973 [Genlisea aurea]
MPLTSSSSPTTATPAFDIPCSSSSSSTPALNLISESTLAVFSGRTLELFPLRSGAGGRNEADVSGECGDANLGGGGYQFFEFLPLKN